MEAKNNEPALSLLESGRESTFSYQADREQLEELRNKVRILESENTDLRRVQPRLIDANGKDVTKEFSKLTRELQNSKNICEELDDERRKLLKSRTELEQSAIMQIDQKDKELSEMKRKAMELEEENLKLREQIHDEQSRIHRLQGADNGNGGDGNFEYYLSKLNQKSISTTLQSFAGLGITQQTDQSIAEHANATIDSMNAMNLAGRTANLAEVCIQMFEKLRGTAEFFQQLLGKLNIGVDEVGEDLMRKIVSMKLDLDKSMSEARIIVNEAKNAEQNIRLFLEQSSQIAMNSTAFEEPITADAEMKTCEKCKDLEREVCEKCTELQEFYETAKSALECELERQKLLEEQIEHLQQKAEEFEATKEQLMLSNKKCDEIQKHFDSVKSELNNQFKEKEDLLKKIAELEQKSSKLEEEKDQISSSIKENQMIPRAQLVEGIRGELGKIYDTMSLASSCLKKKPVLAPSQKTNQTKKNANERAAPPASSSQQPQSQSTSEQTNKQVD